MAHHICIFVLLVLGASPAVADVRHAVIPMSLRGTWALSAQDCNKREAAIVFSERSYAGPKGHCAVRWVIETAGGRGPIYSARLQCPGAEGGQQPAESDLILMPTDANQLSIGDDYNTLKTYQHCQ